MSLLLLFLVFQTPQAVLEIINADAPANCADNVVCIAGAPLGVLCQLVRIGVNGVPKWIEVCPAP